MDKEIIELSDLPEQKKSHKAGFRMRKRARTKEKN
jgi:hypothetical protein